MKYSTRHSLRPKHTRAVTAVGAALALAGLTAVGGSAVGASTVPPDTAVPSSSDDGIEQYLQAPTDMGLPTEPLSSRPEGTRVMYLYLGLPIPTLLADEMEVATAELGIELEPVQVASCGEEFTAAFDRAVDEQPDGVMFGSCPPGTVTEQITALQDAGIPVVAHGVATSPDVDFPVIAGADLFALNGDIAARYVAGQSDEPTGVLLMALPTVAVLHDNFGTALDETLSEVCPDCTLVEEDVTPQIAGQGQVPGLVTNALQANPDVSWVVFEGAAMVRGVPEALDAAGLEASILTLGGESVNWQYIRDGEQVADLGNPLGLVVWRTADLMARALVGDDITGLADISLPTQILVADTVPAADSGPFWRPGDYEDAFRALWAGE